MAEPNGECKTGSIGQEYSDELCQNRGSLENAEPYRDSEELLRMVLKRGPERDFEDAIASPVEREGEVEYRSVSQETCLVCEKRSR